MRDRTQNPAATRPTPTQRATSTERVRRHRARKPLRLRCYSIEAHRDGLAAALVAKRFLDEDRTDDDTAIADAFDRIVQAFIVKHGALD